MGHSASKLPSDPSVYATPWLPEASSVVADEVRTQWRSYDYVIVGGGKYCNGCLVSSFTLHEHSFRDGRMCSCLAAFRRSEHHSSTARSRREVGRDSCFVTADEPCVATATTASFTVVFRSPSSVCSVRSTTGAIKRRMYLAIVS